MAEELTRGVEFVFRPTKSDPQKVLLEGSWDGYANQVPMFKRETGEFATVLPLTSGRVFHYHYLVDGSHEYDTTMAHETLHWYSFVHYNRLELMAMTEIFVRAPGHDVWTLVSFNPALSLAQNWKDIMIALKLPGAEEILAFTNDGTAISHPAQVARRIQISLIPTTPKRVESSASLSDSASSGPEEHLYQAVCENDSSLTKAFTTQNEAVRYAANWEDETKFWRITGPKKSAAINVVSTLQNDRFETRTHDGWGRIEVVQGGLINTIMCNIEGKSRHPICDSKVEFVIDTGAQISILGAKDCWPIAVFPVASAEPVLVHTTNRSSHLSSAFFYLSVVDEDGDLIDPRRVPMLINHDSSRGLLGMDILHYWKMTKSALGPIELTHL